jgi:hypothetical protein
MLGKWRVSDFRKLFGELGRSLVPDSTTSYLTILRTPEPQLSYAVVFVLLGLLLKIGRSEGVPTTASFVATACLSLLLPVTYTYVAFPTLLVAVWIALVTLVYGRHDVALRLRNRGRGLCGFCLDHNRGGRWVVHFLPPASRA